MKDGLLHLCSEDDSEHGEADRNGQTQVQVEQDSADERYQPHQLDGETCAVSEVSSATSKAGGEFSQITTHQVNSVGSPQRTHIHELLKHPFQIHKHYGGKDSLRNNTHTNMHTDFPVWFSVRKDVESKQPYLGEVFEQGTYFQNSDQHNN